MGSPAPRVRMENLLSTLSHSAPIMSNLPMSDKQSFSVEYLYSRSCCIYLCPKICALGCPVSLKLVEEDPGIDHSGRWRQGSIRAASGSSNCADSFTALRMRILRATRGYAGYSIIDARVTDHVDQTRSLELFCLSRSFHTFIVRFREDPRLCGGKQLFEVSRD